MKKVTLLVGLLGAALAMGGDAFACGDKLVVVGRGRPRHAKGPYAAAILVFADPNGSMGAALDQGNLRKDLEHAGHRIRSVSTREELGSALQTGTYDLVFADVQNADSVEAEAQASRSKPTVLPTLYNPTPAELQAAEHRYHCVMKAPSPQKDYISTVNEALAERAKQNPSGKSK
jgi:DNA-binding NtrC family response regulator